MTDLYKVYKSPTTGQWEYDLMTPEEQAMDARTFQGFAWIDDRIKAMTLRNNLTNADIIDDLRLPGRLREAEDFEMQLERRIEALEAQHDRSTAHYHSTDLSGIKADVFQLLDWLFSEATNPQNISPREFGEMLSQQIMGQPTKAWLSEWEAKHLGELYK